MNEDQWRKMIETLERISAHGGEWGAAAYLAIDTILKHEKEISGLKEVISNRWIPCRERLPEVPWGAEFGGILFCTASGYVYSGAYGTGGKYRYRYFRAWNDASEGFDEKDVWAWMLAPVAYQKEGRQ